MAERRKDFVRRSYLNDERIIKVNVTKLAMVAAYESESSREAVNNLTGISL